MSGNNSDIYNNYISVETVQSMEKVEDYRNRANEKIKQNQFDNCHIWPMCHYAL